MSVSDRLHPRISIGPHAMTATIDGEGPAPVKNISVGGFFAQTARRRGVGTEVAITISHGGRTLEARARVTHIQAGGLGLAFCERSIRFGNAIEDLIDRLLSAGASIDERRRVGREIATCAIVWTGGEGGFRHGELRDLSRLGAFVGTEERPPVDTQILMYLPGYLYAPGSSYPSELRGCGARVAHHAEDGFGVEFQEASAEFAMAVEQILNKAK